MGESEADPASTKTLTLNNRVLSYLDAGSGPVVLFVHGLLGSHRHWVHLVEQLSTDCRVLVPDLFGHGDSAKPMGDYSLGAHAATLRDLLDRLGVQQVTIVGHSLGGGIAMQFWYLFPERLQRLVLVSSGGFGRQVSPLLRAAVLPGSEWVLAAIASRWVTNKLNAAGRTLTRFSWPTRPDYGESWRGFASLGDPDSRRAFLASTRAVIDVGGQTVSALDHLTEPTPVPTLMVWGARDRVIPAAHGIAAAQLIDGSRLEIFENAGHFPHLDEPNRFAHLLREFLADPSPTTSGL
jgi:pimeloyl-ACP methyl ester carboxylesterase